MEQLLGKVTPVEGVTLDGVTRVGVADYYGIKAVEYDKVELKELIQDANLAKDVQTGIVALLEIAK